MDLSERIQRPIFKYHPNLYSLEILKAFDGTCDCCGEDDNLFYQGMYCEDEMDICPACISSGRAAKKFDGDFQQDWDHVDNPEAIDELTKRTPGYESWQGEHWKACCNDFCVYLGLAVPEKLEQEIVDELLNSEGLSDRIEDIRAALKNGRLGGHLFQCLHCDRYHLGWDSD